MNLYRNPGSFPAPKLSNVVVSLGCFLGMLWAFCIPQVCGAAAASELQSYPVRFQNEAIRSFNQLAIEFKGISLHLQEGKLLNLETKRGLTGAIIVAPGTVTFQLPNSSEIFRDEVESVLLRFHPRDVQRILNLEEMDSGEDPDFAQRARRNISLFYRCYHRGPDAFIPPPGTLVAVFNGRNYGDKILIHVGDQATLIDPDMAALKARKELAAFGQEKNLTRAESWGRDLLYLKKMLPLRHVNLFFKMSREEFEADIESLQNRAPELSDLQMFAELSALMARIGDSHTRIQPYNVEMSRFPLGFYWLKDGIFVTSAGLQYRDLIGLKVVRVGDTEVEAVCQALARLMAHENTAQLKQNTPFAMVIPELLQASGAVKGGKVNPWSFVNARGKPRIVEVSPISQDASRQVQMMTYVEKNHLQLPYSLEPRKEYYWYTYLEEAGVLYFQYNVCRPMNNRPMEEFTTELLEFLRTHPVKKFIFDLRNNGGGSSPLIAPLIEGLRKSPVNEHGKLYCLIGRRTFSSAILNAVQLKNETHAIFVGEPTSGKPNHYGEVQSFRLPYSNFKVSYSTKYFSHAKEDVPSLAPDILVEPTSQEFFNGTDPALDTVLEP